MMSSTDTNQASEDELQRELERPYRCVVYDLIDDVDREELWIKEVGVAVKELVRTEKLKLLAEVRERVVGEPIPYDWDDDIDDMTRWKYYTGYKSNAYDFVAGYNRSRAERLEQLTKLEAEL